MKKLLILLLAVPALATACGGSTHASSDTTFSDKSKFETYVAGYLGVESVSCVKERATAVECKMPNGETAVVLCEDGDGNNCTISLKD